MNTASLYRRLVATAFALVVGAGLPLATALLMDASAKPAMQQLETVTVVGQRIAG